MSSTGQQEAGVILRVRVLTPSRRSGRLENLIRKLSLVFDSPPSYTVVLS